MGSSMSIVDFVLKVNEMQMKESFSKHSLPQLFSLPALCQLQYIIMKIGCRYTKVGNYICALSVNFV